MCSFHSRCWFWTRIPLLIALLFLSILLQFDTATKANHDRYFPKTCHLRPLRSETTLRSARTDQNNIAACLGILRKIKAAIRNRNQLSVKEENRRRQRHINKSSRSEDRCQSCINGGFLQRLSRSNFLTRIIHWPVNVFSLPSLSRKIDCWERSWTGMAL